ETAKSAQKLVKLEAFHKFENTAQAVESTSDILESNMSKDLKKFLKKEIPEGFADKLVVADTKLGASIAKKLGIKVVSDATTHELMRGIRSQLLSLVDGLEES